MSQNQNIPTPEATDAGPGKTKPAGLSSDAMARRRMLVKSLGKGSSVIAAAAIPMHTLAATGTLAVTEAGTGGRRCTISGTMSGVHSKETVTNVCMGFSRSYYSTLANWPNYVSTGGGSATNYIGSTSFTDKSKFGDVFGSNSLPGNPSLFSLMSSDSDASHWITALLNSVNTKAINFPYSASEVIAFYNSSSQYSNALNFFIHYMETHLS